MELSVSSPFARHTWLDAACEIPQCSSGLHKAWFPSVWIEATLITLPSLGCFLFVSAALPVDALLICAGAPSLFPSGRSLHATSKPPTLISYWARRVYAQGFCVWPVPFAAQPGIVLFVLRVAGLSGQCGHGGYPSSSACCFLLIC